MIVKMFKPEFVIPVVSGEKKQTVRPVPARMPKAHEQISLRTWTGAPYRSKQRVLKESVITEVSMCDISETGVAVNSYAVNPEEFAKADGFKDEFEMQEWFRKTHGLPFEGILIKWA